MDISWNERINEHFVLLHSTVFKRNLLDCDFLLGNKLNVKGIKQKISNNHENVKTTKNTKGEFRWLKLCVCSTDES